MRSTRSSEVPDESLNLAWTRISAAHSQFSSAIFENRLVLADAYHRARWGLAEAERILHIWEEVKAAQIIDFGEALVEKNELLMSSHVRSLQSQSIIASTSFVISIDRIYDAFWNEIWRAKQKVRGGPVIYGESLTFFEMMDMCANYLRHSHEWTDRRRSPMAQKSIAFFELAGIDWRDPLLLPRILAAIPYETFIELEVECYDFIHFATSAAQHNAKQRDAEKRKSFYKPDFHQDDLENGFVTLISDLKFR